MHAVWYFRVFVSPPTLPPVRCACFHLFYIPTMSEPLPNELPNHAWFDQDMRSAYARCIAFESNHIITTAPNGVPPLVAARILG